ncbi:hypothetical protein FHR80_004449 [Cellulomonas cellasea]|uniref:Uncharacterized protein n=1 Tax=Cellulomonas cellasea TaxID=43670 RepID=A0A7W4UJW9_9CELL|nr:hypothetical protein [Cellulomonas cellasea]
MTLTQALSVVAAAGCAAGLGLVGAWVIDRY